MIVALGIFALVTLALTVVLDLVTTEDRDTYEGF